jgi:hypothetical protein
MAIPMSATADKTGTTALNPKAILLGANLSEDESIVFSILLSGRLHRTRAIYGVTPTKADNHRTRISMVHV